jgi:glycosyltransferase involved in cell wall biosynthesis
VRDCAARVAMLLSNSAANDPRVQKEATALAAAGYDTTIVAWDRRCDHEPFEEVRGYHVVRIRVRSSYGEGMLQIPALLAFYARAALELRGLQPSVLHCHDLETLPAGCIASGLLGCRLIFDAHEPSYYADARRLRGAAMAIAARLERALSPRADAVIVTNRYQAGKYESMGVKNVCLVPNYPERSLIRRDPPRDDADPLTIGRIGALYYDMGIEELLEAYRALRKDFPELRLLLAGKSTETYGRALAALAAEIDGDVQLVEGYGYDDLPVYYDRLDVCVMPQKKTKWFEHITPTKFFEALSFGKPVVTTDVGGIGGIVRDEGCGAVLDSVTPEAICEALRPILKDAEVRRSMGMRGVDSIDRRYNWDSSVSSLLEVYSRVIGNGGSEDRPIGGSFE